MDVSGLIGRRVELLKMDRTVYGSGRIVGGYVEQQGDHHAYPQLIMEQDDGRLWTEHVSRVRLLPVPDMGEIVTPFISEGDGPHGR